jgi:SNF2 family DNA or RNA helicase
LDEILLRRTKTSRADDIQLPPRIVKVRQEKLDANEEDYYEALYTQVLLLSFLLISIKTSIIIIIQSQAQFNTYVQSGTVLNNYAHIFDILIRLRQAVDHPYLVIHSNSSKPVAPAITDAKKRKAKDEESDMVPDCGLCHGILHILLVQKLYTNTYNTQTLLKSLVGTLVVIFFVNPAFLSMLKRLLVDRFKTKITMMMERANQKRRKSQTK